jgi:hypothetical protein
LYPKILLFGFFIVSDCFPSCSRSWQHVKELLIMRT